MIQFENIPVAINFYMIVKHNSNYRNHIEDILIYECIFPFTIEKNYPNRFSNDLFE